MNKLGENIQFSVRDMHPQLTASTTVTRIKTVAVLAKEMQIVYRVVRHPVTKYHPIVLAVLPFGRQMSWL